MSQDLIVFAEDWQRHPSSSQHVIKQLAKQRKVLWVNSIGLRRPRLSLGDAKRVIEKLAAYFKRQAPGNSTPANLSVLSPIALPAPRSSLMRWLNQKLLAWQVNRRAKALGIVQPTLWLALPTAVDLLGKLNEQKVIYYCGDDFGSLAGVDHQQVSKCEARLALRADHILVASETLLAKFKRHPRLNRKTQLLSHGVDYSLFVNPVNPAPSLVKGDYVAGFYGCIADWLDVNLLARVARRLPHWRFIFVGDVQTDISVLRGLENVEFLPAVAHRELPHYVQHWTVSLLPFKKCKQIQACNPLKLREYLAAGKPIVSTPFPALKQYPGLVTQVRGVSQFVEALQQYEQMPVSLLHRLSAFQRLSVREESWQQRAAQVESLLRSA